MAVGSTLWVQTVPAHSGATTPWLVVEPTEARIVARLALPSGWKVLGGDARAVIVALRDQFDVELVRVYDIVR